ESCDASLLTFDGIAPPPVSWNSAGMKIVTFTTSNLNGCDSTLIDTIYVEEYPIAYAGPDKTVQCGDSTWIGMWHMPQPLKMLPAAGSRGFSYAQTGILVDAQGWNAETSISSATRYYT